jgi:hypothetical protein
MAAVALPVFSIKWKSSHDTRAPTKVVASVANGDKLPDGSLLCWYFVSSFMKTQIRCYVPASFSFFRYTPDVFYLQNIR